MANTHEATGPRSIIEELNALRERHIPPSLSKPSAINELHQTLAELEKRLTNFGSFSQPTQSQDMSAVRPIQGLSEIAEHLRHLTAAPTKEDDSTRTTYTSYPARPFLDVRDGEAKDAHRFDRIEVKLAELSKQFDNSVAEQNSDALFSRLGELAQRIDALGDNASQTNVARDQALEQLAHYVDLLARHVSTVVQEISLPDLQEVETRLHAIDLKLAIIEKKAQQSDTALHDKIDSQFHALTKHLDAQYASHYADGGLLRTIEDRFDEITKQIALSTQQTAPVKDTSFADSEAIRGLENQINNLARQLTQPSAEFAELKPRLDVIERAVTNNQETILDTVRKAATSAVEQVLKHGSQRDTTIALQLSNDLKSLESLARHADERNGKIFESVHATLAKVVDSLSNLERQMEVAPQISQKIKPIANPYSTAATAGQALPSVLKDASEHRSPLVPKSAQEPKLSGSLDSVQPDNDSVLDLNTIMKRVREERDQLDTPQTPTKSKADLIGAARRAAQQAADESAKIGRNSEKPIEKKKGTISDLFNRQRKPILLGIGAVMLAIAGLQIGAALIEGQQSAQVAAATETAEIDSETTASITPQHDAANLAKLQPMPETVKHQTMDAQPNTAPKLQNNAPTDEPEAQQAVAEPAPHASMDIPLNVGSEALREAAAQGDAVALFEVGNRYMEGRGVTEDLTEAARWFEKSAEKGFALAQYRLGSMNEKGIGMPRNLTHAINWYQLAAAQGNAGAMHNLAVLYASGATGTPDNALAVRWFTEASDFGVKDSQYNLAILAAKGLGMPVNLEESYKWFALAAQSGDKDAADKRDQIGAALKPERLEHAKATTELWKAKPLNEATNTLEIPQSWSDNPPVAEVPVDMKKAVKNIQLILQKNGYDVGTADGIMGNKTRNAIFEIQKANGQDPTGKVDQKLVQLLLEKNK